MYAGCIRKPQFMVAARACRTGAVRAVPFVWNLLIVLDEKRESACNSKEVVYWQIGLYQGSGALLDVENVDTPSKETIAEKKERENEESS